VAEDIDNVYHGNFKLSCQRVLNLYRSHKQPLPLNITIKPKEKEKNPTSPLDPEIPLQGEIKETQRSEKIVFSQPIEDVLSNQPAKNAYALNKTFKSRNRVALPVRFKKPKIAKIGGMNKDIAFLIERCKTEINEEKTNDAIKDEELLLINQLSSSSKVRFKHQSKSPSVESMKPNFDASQDS